MKGIRWACYFVVTILLIVKLGNLSGAQPARDAVAAASAELDIELESERIDTPHPRAGEGYETSEETISWYRTFIRLPYLPGWAAGVADWAMLVGSLRNTSAPETFPEDVLDQFRSAWDRENAIQTMTAWYRAPFRLPESDEPVSVPTLVLVAPDDAFIPGDLTRRSMRFLSNGELLELESGTHWSIQERPQEIARLLIRFFS
jgi:pimeloyl-ACP methyl ester carboxylesterase